MRIRALISLILIVSISVSMSFPVESATYDERCEEAFRVLNCLGIVDLPEEEGFDAQAHVTRGEFLLIITRVMGLYNIKLAVSPTGKFEDIADQELRSYAQMADSLSIMRGTSQDEFSPNDELTYNQAITVLVRAVGYEPYALTNGGYPVGYIVTANEINLLKNVKAYGEQSIVFGDLVMMVYNALTIPQLIQPKYGSKASEWIISSKSNAAQTLLKNSLGFEKYLVEIIGRSNIDSEQENGFSTLTVHIMDDDTPTNYKYPAETIVSFVLDASVSPEGLENTIQTVYVKDDKIYCIEGSDKITFLFDYLYEIGDSEESTPIALKDIIAGKNRLEFLKSGTTCRITEDSKIYYNTISVDDKTPMEPEDSSLLSHLGRFAKAVIDDDELISLYIYELSEDIVITEISGTSITYRQGDKKGQKMRDIDEAKRFTVILDGEASKYEDLEEEMVINYRVVGGHYMIVASSEFALARLEAISDDMATLDGEDYYLAPTYYYSEDFGQNYISGQKGGISALLGGEAYAYINPRGEISYIRVEVESLDFFGIALSVYNKGFDDYVAVYRAVGRGTTAGGTRTEYVLKLKNSPVWYEELKSSAGDLRGGCIYEFRLNGKKEVIRVSRPQWLPYFEQVDFPHLSEYVFPAGTQNMVTKLYSSGSITRLDFWNNYIRYRPKVFTFDGTVDATGEHVGPRAGLRGNYRRATGSAASDALYVDEYGAAIEDSEIHVTPERLVPITTTTGAVERCAFVNDDTVIFSLVDNNGNFNPSLLRLNEITDMRPGGLEMMIEGSYPYTRLAVVIGGKETLESNSRMWLGYVKELSLKTNLENPDGIYTVEIITDEMREREYVIAPEKANGIKEGTIIGFREYGTVLDPRDEEDGIPYDVLGNGSIRVYYTYNPEDIDNNGTNKGLENAEHGSTSLYTSVALDLNNYVQSFKYNQVEGLDDRVLNSVEYVDEKMVLYSENGVRTTCAVAATCLVYQYNPNNGSIIESSIHEITPQSDKVWMLKRDGIVRGLFYIK